MSCDGYAVDSTVALKVHTHNYETKITKATTTKNGSIVTTCTICGDEHKTTIYAANKINLSATQYIYNGSVKKPSVSVIGADNKPIDASNYTVTYPSGCKNVGVYTVTVTFKGSYYSGSKNLKFTIVPKGTTISGVTAGKKKLTVKVKKQATQTTGYEVWVATDKKFTKNVKKKSTTKNSATKLAFTSLKGKTSYYIRVRTYKIVNKVKYYSGWTVYKKTVKTK